MAITFSGFRFDVSKFCNIPLDSPALQSVLDNLDSDDAWDETNPLEKAMFEAGETRYDMNTLRKGHKRTSHSDYMEEKTSSKEKKSKSKDVDEPPVVRVKLENPMHTERQTKVTCLKSGKAALQKLLEQAEDMVAHLEHKGKTEDRESTASKTALLTQFLQQLRTYIIKATALSKEELTQEVLAELEEWSQKTMAHKDGMTNHLKVLMSTFVFGHFELQHFPCVCQIHPKESMFVNV